MKLFLRFSLVFVFGVVIFLSYSGAFKRVSIKEAEVGPYKVLYKNHIGDYKQTGKIQDEVYSFLLGEKNIKTSKGFGIYYDDPRTTNTDSLRSIAGCIVESKDYSKLIGVNSQYSLKDLPKAKSIIAEFPFRNRLSVFFGIMKVYPKLEKYMNSKGYKKAPVMEIYDVPNKKIQYIVPISE